MNRFSFPLVFFGLVEGYRPFLSPHHNSFADPAQGGCGTNDLTIIEYNIQLRVSEHSHVCGGYHNVLIVSNVFGGDVGDGSNVSGHVVYILLLPMFVVAEKTSSADHIDFAIDHEQFFSRLKLFGEHFLVVHKIEAAEIVLSEYQHMLMPNRVQCDYLFADGQTVVLVVAVH